MSSVVLPSKELYEISRSTAKDSVIVGRETASISNRGDSGSLPDFSGATP
jgi:hypothetical protein